jgi:DNA-binding beta-propeller fold protein YncE
MRRHASLAFILCSLFLLAAGCHSEGMTPAGLTPAESGASRSLSAGQAPSERPGFVTTRFGQDFFKPSSIAIWKENVFVADPGTHSVTEFGADHVIRPVGSSTDFPSPRGVAVDATGNVYVVNRRPGELWKIPPPYTAPTPLATGFNDPQGVAVDPSGDKVYVSDTGNKQIVLVEGSSSKPFATLGKNAYPVGLGLDGAGDIYVADLTRSGILELSPTGKPLGVIGKAYHPNGVTVEGHTIYFTSYMKSLQPSEVFEVSCAHLTTSPTCQQQSIVGSGFLDPSGVAYSQPDLYVADQGNGVTPGWVYNVTQAGRLRTIGTGFDVPQNLAVDVRSHVTNVYVADSGEGSVKVIHPGKSAVLVGRVGEFPQAQGVAFDSVSNGNTRPDNFAAGPLLIADQGGIQRFDRNRAVNTVHRFNKPTDVGLSKSGVIYVANNAADQIDKLTSTGKNIPPAVSFRLPQSIAVDSSGNVFVAGPKGCAEIVAGSVRPLCNQLPYETAIAVDGAGYIYVADTLHNEVSLLTPKGEFVAALGSGFHNPNGLAVDKARHVYIADYSNSARNDTGVIDEFVPPRAWPPPTQRPWLAPSPTHT